MAAQLMAWFVVLLVAGIVLIPAAIALAVRFLTKRDSLSIVVGGIFLPALALVGLVYYLATMEVDDAPPGMVILGNLLLIAIGTPVGMLASYLTVRLTTGRAR